MAHRNTLFAVISLTLLSSGCVSPMFETTEDAFARVGGALAGTLWNVDIDTAADVDASGNPHQALVEVIGYAPSGVVMQVVMVSGALDDPRLAVGHRHTFTAIDPPEEPGALWVGVIGCAGTTADRWEYDGVARHVEVRIDAHPELPDARVFTVTSRFDTGDVVDTVLTVPGRP